MRITLVTVVIVTVAVACLSLAPCVPARPQPSLCTDSGLVNAKQVDETMPTPFGTHHDFLNPLASAPGVDRRSLKSSSNGSKSKPSKPKKSKAKSKKATLLGSVIGAIVFLVVFALCVAFIIVTEKREEDRNWRVRTLLRRKLKRKYSKAGKAGKGDDIDDMEKPHVEQELPDEAGDLGTRPVKKVEPPDVK